MKVNMQKLEIERNRLGLSKTAFSKKFGLSPAAYRKIEAAESTTIKTLTKIAATLYLDPKDLLTN
jgi:transcriptional regulator with XRE-family HTH domain